MEDETGVFVVSVRRSSGGRRGHFRAIWNKSAISGADVYYLLADVVRACGGSVIRIHGEPSICRCHGETIAEALHEYEF